MCLTSPAACHAALPVCLQLVLFIGLTESYRVAVGW